MARVTEAWQSRPLTGQTAEIWYIIDQTDDEQDARDAMIAECPTTFDSKVKDDYSCDKIGKNLFKGIVKYKAKGSGMGIPGAELTGGIEFNTTGGVRRIFTSRSTATYTLSGPPTDRDNAILVDANGQINGCEIIVPKFTFRIRRTFTPARLTDAYVKMLRDMTGTTNAAAWKGFAAEEVLFLGANGAQTGSDSEVVFEFDSGKNVPPTQVVAGINVTGFPWAWKAHDFVWVYYDTVAPNGAQFAAPKATEVSVETVYGTSNFDLFGI